MPFPIPQLAVGHEVSAADWDEHVDALNLLKTKIGDDGFLNVLLDRSTTEQDVSNTAVETSVYSFSVPGGIVGSANLLHLMMLGYIDLTTLSADLNIRGKFGGVTFAGGAFTVTASTKGAVRFDAVINGNGATNSQRAVTRLSLPGAGVVTTDGVYDGGTGVATSTTRHAAHSSLAIDTTTAQTIQITAQWSSALANAHFKRFAAALRVLRT